MKAVINVLVKIFKQKANIEASPADEKRQTRVNTQRQRVATEESERQPQRVEQTTQGLVDQRVPASVNDNGPQRVPPDEDEDSAEDGTVLMPGLEVTYPSLKDPQPHPNVVSQDWDGPSQNPRAARNRRLLAAVEASGCNPTALQGARRQVPLQFLVDLAAAVLDEETGELLEYRHLIKRPKTKAVWGYSFGNEIGRLAQGMPG